MVRWGCKAVNAAWAADCPELRRGPVGLQAVNAAWAAACPELRNNVSTPAGDETVVQM